MRPETYTAGIHAYLCGYMAVTRLLGRTYAGSWGRAS